jgi:hypothetical protein
MFILNLNIKALVFKIWVKDYNRPANKFKEYNRPALIVVG